MGDEHNMKKLISFILIFAICFSTPAVIASAEEVVNKEITSIELQTAKYYSAVKTDAEIENATFFVDFIAYYSDGTSAEYDSTHGWSDESITSEVSWRIAPDESLGDQQILFITVNGEEYWAGYVKVEVNKAKAIFRTIVTLDGTTIKAAESTHIFLEDFFLKLKNMLLAFFAMFGNLQC
jgi:hypothetical protein